MQTTPEFSPIETDKNDDLQERAFSSSGCCCFWNFGSRESDNWERISMSEEQQKNAGGWWAKGINALKKVREWSEIVAGPKWKTFIRRFNKTGRCKTGKFQYDPLSYALNFDDGQGQNSQLQEDQAFRNFSSRYAAIPSKGLMDLCNDAPTFT
ncbi:NHL domain-containing protein [Forsythia ovata]|uniref:NHL domain-containing protein n=1 Tax=Forsythia ovata TaxID=205694 RepID=A0ABD1UEA0_9LAMI